MRVEKGREEVPGEVSEGALVEQAELVRFNPVADLESRVDRGSRATERGGLSDVGVRTRVSNPFEHLGRGQRARLRSEEGTCLLVRDDPDVRVGLRPVKEGVEHVAHCDGIGDAGVAGSEVDGAAERT